MSDKKLWGAGSLSPAPSLSVFLMSGPVAGSASYCCTGGPMLPVGFVIGSSNRLAVPTCWFVLLLHARLRPQHLGQNL